MKRNEAIKLRKQLTTAEQQVKAERAYKDEYWTNLNKACAERDALQKLVDAQKPLPPTARQAAEKLYGEVMRLSEEYCGDARAAARELRTTLDANPKADPPLSDPEREANQNKWNQMQYDALKLELETVKAQWNAEREEIRGMLLRFETDEEYFRPEFTDDIKRVINLQGTTGADGAADQRPKAHEPSAPASPADYNCPATNPVTGGKCVKPRGHSGPHACRVDNDYWTWDIPASPASSALTVANAPPGTTFEHADELQWSKRIVGNDGWVWDEYGYRRFPVTEVAYADPTRVRNIVPPK